MRERAREGARARESWVSDENMSWYIFQCFLHPERVCVSDWGKESVCERECVFEGVCVCERGRECMCV